MIRDKKNPDIYKLENKHINKTIPISVLEGFWFCPIDKSHLEQYIQKISQSTFFTVTQNNIEISLKNALIMKKIPKSENQTLQLVNKLFNEYPLEELSFVCTQCPTCFKFYSCPLIYLTKLCEMNVILILDKLSIVLVNIFLKEK